jgi:hypothetical protein
MKWWNDEILDNLLRVKILQYPDNPQLVTRNS